MGFHSSLIFYRPTKPPVVTGAALAGFMERFAQLGVSNRHGKGMVQIKFGDAIDQDMEPSWSIEPTASPEIGVTKDIEWDFQRFAAPLEETKRMLGGTDRCIYRAHVGLGAAAVKITSALSRAPSRENAEPFSPDSWSLIIDPIELGTDGEFIVGWLGLALGGNGYLHPWPLKDFIAHVERLPAVQAAMKCCREFWPVAFEPVPLQVQSAREEMGRHWPYERVDLPWDWHWGMQGLI